MAINDCMPECLCYKWQIIEYVLVIDDLEVTVQYKLGDHNLYEIDDLDTLGATSDPVVVMDHLTKLSKSKRYLEKVSLYKKLLPLIQNAHPTLSTKEIRSEAKQFLNNLFNAACQKERNEHGN